MNDLDTPQKTETEQSPEVAPDQESQAQSEQQGDTAPLDDLSVTVKDTEDLSPIIPIKTNKSKTKQTRLRLSEAVRCDLGAVRERNEDSCITFTTGSGGSFPTPPFGLYVVADGMGGHTNGHIASDMAARMVVKHVLEQIYLPLVTAHGAANLPPIQEVLEKAAQLANTAVYANDPEIDSGTTLTVALIFDRRLYVTHIGDSRLYLFTADQYAPVTKDHSLVQRLEDVGQLTEAARRKYGNVLLKALGQAEEVEVDTYMRLLPSQGKLLLCSDGLWGFVDDQHQREILANKDLSLDEMVNQLYDAAMDAGGLDNITAVVVDFSI